MTSGERSLPTGEAVLAPLASLSGALLVVGLPFVVQWQRANGIDPASFGSLVAGVAIAGIALAFVVGTRVRRWRGTLVSFGLLVAAAGSAIVIASRSELITAEGILTAMLLPVGLLAAAVVASLGDAGFARGIERAILRRLCVLAIVVSLSAAVAWRLPVVQFVHAAASDGVYPVQGSWLAFVSGVATAAISGPVPQRWSWNWGLLLIPLAIVLGYMLQASFGAALTILGICLAMPEWKRRTIEAELP